MYSLFIDTHYKEVVIVLYKDGLVIDKKIHEGLKHSEVTMPLIVDIIKQNNLEIKDINEIICVSGPGSFTGVRIGITIGKMLAISLNIKIKIIDYLKIMSLFTNNAVSIVDRNGAYVGNYSNRELIEPYSYLNIDLYNELKTHKEINETVLIDYDQLYNYLKEIPAISPHQANPVYIKNVVN